MSDPLSLHGLSASEPNLSKTTPPRFSMEACRQEDESRSAWLRTRREYRRLGKASSWGVVTSSVFLDLVAALLFFLSGKSVSRASLHAGCQMTTPGSVPTLTHP